WVHLNLPMRYEGVTCIHEPAHPCSSASKTSLGFSDPRTEQGELMEPVRWPEHRVVDLEQRIGAHATACQLQQRPAPREGGLFHVERLQVVRERNGTVQAACRYWDKAATQGGGDYTAGVLVERLSTGRFLIAHVSRGQWSPGRREATIQQIAATEPSVRIRHEQEPGSAGVTDAQATNRMLAGYDVRAVPSTGSKETRALPLARQVEAGNVDLLAGEWNRDLLDELRMWPHGRYRDQGDAAAGAFNDIALDTGTWI
ncbi:MAG TPA: phage terminase large subunit, partial [Thermoleophilia bacterium]|nr:phage terminase large subunit [Thermoleophilia bacterium]